jgi:uncharacterized protein
MTMEGEINDIDSKVDQSIIDTAKRYVHSIPERLELKKAFLFGSYAKGRAHTDSDIDIAVVIGHMDDFFPFKCS